MMQGFAILAMVILHLFDTLSYKEKFIPLFYFHGYPLVFFFAQLSDFCVMAFAFCSGYAHMSQFKTPQYYKHRLINLLALYIRFWIVLIIFCAISIFIGNGEVIPGDLRTFIGNLTTLQLSYNGAWWYLLTYALIIISSPILLSMSKYTGHRKTIIVLLFSSGLYCTAYYERFTLNSTNWFLRQFGLYGMTAVEYIMGACAFEYRIFSLVISTWNRFFKTPFLDLTATLSLFFLLLMSRTLIFPQLFFAPLSGFLLLVSFQRLRKPNWLRSCFYKLGTHSTNIWLTHMFFYLHIFTNLVYMLKYPIFIVLFMISITMLTSVVVNAIYFPIIDKIKSKLV